MSRISKQPIILNNKVNVKLKNNNIIIISCDNIRLMKKIHHSVLINIKKSKILISPINNSKESNMHAGTSRSLINSMVLGVQTPFEKKLKLVGVGYKAQKINDILKLNIGFSHVINYRFPNEVSIDLPSSTDIVLKSPDKYLVGQIASNIRNYRVPESYKGKGIRYFDENIVIKEAKKK